MMANLMSSMNGALHKKSEVHTSKLPPKCKLSMPSVSKAPFHLISLIPVLVSQIQTVKARAPPRAQSQARESRGRRGARGESRGAFRGGFKSNRKASGGSNKSKTSSGGVRKVSSTRKGSSSFGAGPSRKGGYESGGFGGGIGMMPT